MRVTIEQAAMIVRELSEGSDPSLLHALRVAGISPRMKLASNMGYGDKLCPWRNSPLPPREELVSVLSTAIRMDGSGKPTYGLMGSHVDTLYAIDEFWFGNPANQDIAYEIGESLEDQRAWRCRMNSLVRGMGFKCLSWALFIYQPETCKLLTLDSWHARRLMVDSALVMRDTLASHSLYVQLEDKVIAETAELFPGYPSTVGAACLWFNIRGQKFESHAGLNCRVQEVYA